MPGGAPVSPICLGPRLPRGTPFTELVLAAYSALCLQHITFGEDDPAGLLNVEAARYFQARPELIPLSTEPFLPVHSDSDDPEDPE